MAKAYKTANGKLIDMDGLRLKNEDTIALGNMRTNARGDELGPGGRVIKTRNERMNENYKLHSMVPKDDLVHDSIDAVLEQQVVHETGFENKTVDPTFNRTGFESQVLSQTKAQTVHQEVTEVVPQEVVPQEEASNDDMPKKTTHSNFGNIAKKEDEPVVVSAAKKPRGGLAASVSKPIVNKTSIPKTKIKRI